MQRDAREKGASDEPCSKGTWDCVMFASLSTRPNLDHLILYRYEDLNTNRKREIDSPSKYIPNWRQDLFLIAWVLSRSHLDDLRRISMADALIQYIIHSYKAGLSSDPPKKVPTFRAPPIQAHLSCIISDGPINAFFPAMKPSNPLTYCEYALPFFAKGTNLTEI